MDIWPQPNLKDHKIVKSWNLTTPPAQEPVSLSNVKTFIRLDSSSEDAILNAFISAARKHAEQYTQRAFITQTWDAWLDDFPVNADSQFWDGVRQGAKHHVFSKNYFVEIPIGLVQSVVHIKTYGEDDTESTFDSSKYRVDDSALPGRIMLKEGEVWPTDLRNLNAINIQWKAGYGDDPGDVPDDIIQAIYITVGYLYEHRGECEPGSELPPAAKMLLDSYRVIRL